MQEVIRDLTERVERHQADNDALIRQVAALERIASEAETRLQQAVQVKDEIEQKLLKVESCNYHKFHAIMD